MLSANVAKIIITPPVGTSMLEPPSTPTTGIHTDLYCRTVVISDGENKIAIVSLDLLGVDQPLLRNIRQAVLDRTELSAEQLMLTATHNHSAPVTLDCGFDDDRNREWEGELVNQIAECVYQASQDLQLITLAIARHEVKIGVNRRVVTMGRTRMLANKAAPIVPWVDILSINRIDGTAMAILFCHVAHPVTVHGASTQFNADFPGYAVQTITNSLSEDVIPMFVQGCAGDINVVSLAGGLDEAQRLGTILGEAVLAGLLHATTLNVETITIINKETTLPFEHLTEDIISALSHRIEESYQAMASMNMDRRTLINQQQFLDWAKRVRHAPSGLWFQAQGIAFGNQLLMIGMPHEPFVAYQLTIDKESPAPHTMVFGYTNGCNGYIPTAEAFYLGGYEVDGAPKLFGLPRLLPDCEQVIYKTVNTIFDEFKILTN
ncbi:MAG: neutral/alkaline non-lysosomal ceramidase N-terminal domain-containing protein [Chloroflexota bacterium]